MTLNKIETDLLNLSEKVIKASLLWCGEDEEANPTLKTMRTLAGFYRDQLIKKQNKGGRWGKSVRGTDIWWKKN